MSLPFKKHKEASISVAPEIVKRNPDQEQEYDPLESAAEDLINAIQSKDTKSAADAIRAAFDILDSGPHFEGPHTNGEQ